MEKLTSGQLLTLMEKTLKDLRSATSSLESAVGAMHSNLQDGNQLDLFGQEAHHANHSPLPETRKEKTMSDTSGGHSSSSSASVNLQQFLASKLPQQLEQSGSTIYKLTWKTKVTPRQWQYCQLVASVPRTKESDCSSWPTPVASDNRDRGSFDDPSIQRRMRIGKSVELSMMVHSIQPWPTPSTQDNPQVRGEGAAANHPSRGTTLGGAARMVPWGTPNVMDSMAPRSDEALARAKQKAGCANIKDQVPYSAETEKPVKSQLNPRFSLWLMGYPIEWAYCAERVMLSSRKSGQK